jgi:formate--tetrahydrofolate ligase
MVGINRYRPEGGAEHRAVLERCAALGLRAHVVDVYDRGGAGGLDLARGLVDLLDSEPSAFAPLYALEMPITSKLEALATRIYGADGVAYTRTAERQIVQAEALGYGRLPVCVAKTQRSLSDEPDRLGRPRGFRITVRDLRVSAGAGFLVASTGDITTMPGLPRRPNAERVELAGDGSIVGLF